MTPAEELRAAASTLARLPIQNVESAHVDKDELTRMMKRLARLWEIPTDGELIAANDNSIRDIALGVRIVKTRGGHREVRVESRNRRSSAA